MALVTAFANRYREDQFLRTEWNLVALQIGFALILLAVVWVGFTSIHQDVTSALIARIVEAMKQGNTAGNMTPESILRSVEEVQARSLIAIVSAIILTTALFGYALARLALIPTRNALSSQKQFIGNIAHELRTPLSIIKTNTEVALFDDSLDIDVKMVLKSTVQELDRISGIIDNLLSISAFVRPERIEFSNVDLGTVVDTVIADLEALVKRKNQSMSVKKAEFRMVWGNETALVQIVMNLVKNAVNYTPRGGHVAVSVEPDYHGHITLTVKDTGIGIARKDLFRIFEPFYRAEESRSRISGSSGLGLTVVSELIKMHHGKISIQSLPKRGTTVIVLLPCGKFVGEDEEKPKGERADLGEIAVDFTS
ncbi:HAMP domain-containing histidine kinase [Candidatus Kaiserbacteria bacterium]|nr:HAMP domain-containing histidine kinase [Candidatus Kaiserbacteria bacterium]